MPLTFTPCKADPELKALGIERDDYKYDYVRVSADLRACVGDEGEMLNPGRFYEIMRTFGRRDLFFFAYFILDLPVNDPFLLARCYDVQDKADGVMDLWARGYWKSTIKTYAYILWLLVKNPENRIGIFSHTRAISKDHMRRSKTAMEWNEHLKKSYPDVFYERPKTQAPKWNEDVGLFVRRKKNYPDASIEAHGLDDLPTGKHFTWLIYDDIIDLDNVNTAAMITKTTISFRNSLFLASRKHHKTINGTIYAHNDTYADIMRTKEWEVRKFPAEIDEEGNYKHGGKPVFWTREELDKKFKDINNEYIYNCQMGLDPKGSMIDRFDSAWLENSYYEKAPENVAYRYILADPGRKPERRNDYTVYWVIETDPRRYIIVLDCVRDKMSSEQKWQALKGLVMRWGVAVCGYEHVGLAADKDYMDNRMVAEGVFFQIIETNPKNVPKAYRIQNLSSDFKMGRIRFPRSIYYKDINGVTHDLMLDFIYDEYDKWPRPTHDDFLDTLAQIHDSKIGITYPPPELAKTEEKEKPDLGDPLGLMKPKYDPLEWMTT